MEENIIISLYQNTNFEARDLANIHLGSLFSNDKFSRKYLEYRMKYVDSLEGAIIVVAFNPNNKLLGLVYGGPEGYKNKMNQVLTPKIVKTVALRPYLITNKAIAYKITSKIKSISKRQKGNEISSNIDIENSLPRPILRLTGIVIDPHLRSKGVGSKLLNEFVNQAKNHNYNSIILNTPLENTAAIRFYERHAWKNLGELEEGKNYFSLEL
ncbi:GNAT family N-acetyltransferase [Salinicoccus roseus]|uniref:N-acetyltransferase domain-containing protein n=1 Tax=Salinicoccus roseus TaxID=45670 RepID=A0A265E5J9_9STAP|nr:GNAT family N-acetyltransferase [Salinicoccus roseus]OZT76871.1 hypothetical protein CFN03_07265 [Salinicoccus roseus]